MYTVAFKEMDQWLTINRKLRTRKDLDSRLIQTHSPYTVPTYTVPTTLITENFLQNAQTRGKMNTTYSVFAPQPVVKFAQGDTIQGRDWTSSLEVKFVQDDGTTRSVLSNMGDVVRQVRSPGEIVMSSDLAYQYFDPVWMPSPEKNSSSLIGMFLYCRWAIDKYLLATPVESRSLKNLTEILEMHPEKKSNCTARVGTISAYWNNSEAILDASGLRFSSLADWWEVVNERPITLNLSSVGMTNVTLQRTIATLFDDYRVPWEDVIGTAFALAISKVPIRLHHKTLFMNKYDITYGNYTDEDLDNMTTFTYTSTDFGYGYGTTSTSVYLSMIIISSYCVFTILYLAYILITGSTSTAWNSAIEVVALALQSKRSKHLGKVSVGIDTLSTFNQGVGIRVNAEDELELVFANVRDVVGRDLREIELNREY